MAQYPPPNPPTRALRINAASGTLHPVNERGSLYDCLQRISEILKRERDTNELGTAVILDGTLTVSRQAEE